MPLYRRLPKHGFNNSIFQPERIIVSLARINDLFNDGDEITQDLLIERGVIRVPKGKKSLVIKVLANGQIEKNLWFMHMHLARLLSALLKVQEERLG